MTLVLVTPFLIRYWTPSVKAIVDELDFIKVKNLCSVKDNIKRIRREALGQEKIFAKFTPDKELLPKIYKEVLQLNNKKTNHLITKWAQNFKLTKENILMGNKHMIS